MKRYFYYIVCIILVLATIYAAYHRWKPKPKQYNLLIITLDTLRYDCLSATGHPWLKTPYLDSLANRGILFTNAYSSSNQTAPSHKTLFTGVSPVVHGIRINTDKVRDDFLLPSLAEILRKGSIYHTIALFQGPFTAKDPYKILKGFVEINPPPPNMSSMPEKGHFFTQDTLFTDSAMAALDRAKQFKWFMWLHYWIPHAPYLVDELEKAEYIEDYPSDKWWSSADSISLVEKKILENRYFRAGIKPAYAVNKDKYMLVIPYSKENKTNLSNLYTLQIPSLDKQIGRLFNYLKANKLFDNTIIVLIADHGEALMDRNGEYGHGTSLYDTILHVPFILILPKSFKGKRIDALVRIIDVTPTLLDLLKIRDPAKDLREGMSLVPLMKGTGPGPLSVYSILEDSTFSYRDLHWKYLWNTRESGKHELYDIRQDKWELNNLADKYPDQVKRYFDLLSNWNKQKGSSKITDPEHLKRLKSLGYIN